MSPEIVNFGGAIRLFFRNYSNYTGRSTQSEFWYYFLFDTLVSVGAFFMAVFFYHSPYIKTIRTIYIIWRIVTVVPSLSLAFRRLHDRGKPWWYLFLSSAVFGLASAPIGALCVMLGGKDHFLFIAPYIYTAIVFNGESDGENKWGLPASGISFSKIFSKSEKEKIEKEYAEQSKKESEEKLNAISLKDGWRLASVPSRIFATKIDKPKKYCCPYCYAQVPSEFSSMCGNCGESLCVQEKTQQ